MVAGSVPGESVVIEVKAIDQALVALPILGRRIAGSGAWHSRSSVAPGGPHSEEDALSGRPVQEVWASPEPIGRRIESMRRPFFPEEGGPTLDPLGGRHRSAWRERWMTNGGNA
jgi:hypothetical protein